MKILLIADVHNRPGNSIKTRKGIKQVIESTAPDLIVFLGDTVHGPAVKRNYEKYLRQILDLTGDIPFASVFGNHDDECSFTKEEILAVSSTYPNCVTKGRDYVLDMNGESLIFIDSGSYYEGDGSYYDTVKAEQIALVKEQMEGKENKGILFQHIIIPDIFELMEEKEKGAVNSYEDNGKYFGFRDGVSYIGELREKPCPPDINTHQLDELKDCVKAMCFGHDHLNSFELTYKGVKLIQCAGSSYNSYDKKNKSCVKLLDTKTLCTEYIYI